MDNQEREEQEYTINVRVRGYADLTINMKVLAKDADDAFMLACGKEFRFQDSDKYVLVAMADDYDYSALCTYETLEEAMVHVGTITSGEWLLVQRDDEGESIVIKQSCDDDI